MIRTGEEYRTGLRDGREVWIDGERVGDVTAHPAFKPIVDAVAHFTWLANFIGVDSPASSALTRELLGWQPTNIGLITDLDQGHYFGTPAVV